MLDLFLCEIEFRLANFDFLRILFCISDLLVIIMCVMCSGSK